MSQTTVAVIVPYDFALDRELWRWVPDDVSVALTRTPYQDVPVGAEQALLVSALDTVAQCARDLAVPEPAVAAYGCTSGSFVGGPDGERRIVAAMRSSGIPEAVTTSGALLEALACLDARRVVVATPYDEETTTLLAGFLGRAGVEVCGSAHLGMTGRIETVPPATTADLVRSAFVPECDAVVVSCTNLATYDVLATLEDELGVPVVSANQVTMWAALARVGRSAVGPRQRLVEHPAVAAR